jgi:hypothetical protein
MASWMFWTIASQAPAGSAVWPPTICASVAPQKDQTELIAGMAGIGAPVAPASLKPWRTGSSTLSAEAVSAGRRPPAAYSASCASSVVR